MNNAILFDFQGEPPAPFDTLDSPRLTEPQYLSVYNGYGEKQVSTLSPALISAIHVYLDLKKAAVNGGVGKSDQCTFAEYQSAAGEIRLAKYNKNQRCFVVRHLQARRTFPLFRGNIRSARFVPGAIASPA